jgi:hypothetical protein
MGNRYLLQRLIEWLNKLSDSELEELSRLFSEPQVRTKLFAIIDNALALRHIEGKPKLQPVASARDWPSGMPKREVGRVLRGDAASSVDHSTEVKHLFFEVFEDTSLFPSRRDMLDAMNQAFNCGFEYREHEKRGRKDLIIKCWNKLKDLPRDEQRKKLRTFVSRISESKAGRDDYKELFKLLVNHE